MSMFGRVTKESMHKLIKNVFKNDVKERIRVRKEQHKSHY